MIAFTFITGNQNKADYLSKLLQLPVDHQKIDVDEIQSVNLKEVVERKARQAYTLIQKPVLVEDVSLEFNALNGLPGTFIKFFVEYTGLEATCRLLDGFSDRTAIAKCAYAYYDGSAVKIFEGSIEGEIATKPSAGTAGFGWDKIFIPNGYSGKIRAELNEAEYDELYKIIKPIDQLREFLEN
jgi:XTP/dITP diphosphohydrolase